jgi:hypothetical protein
MRLDLHSATVSLPSFFKYSASHRVDRVLGFSSSHPNWNKLSHPLTRRRVCPSTRLAPGGDVHTRLGEMRWGVPIPTRGKTLWYSRYVCTLWRELSNDVPTYVLHRQILSDQFNTKFLNLSAPISSFLYTVPRA